MWGLQVRATFTSCQFCVHGIIHLPVALFILPVDGRVCRAVDEAGLEKAEESLRTVRWSYIVIIAGELSQQDYWHFARAYTMGVSSVSSVGSMSSVRSVSSRSSESIHCAAYVMWPGRCSFVRQRLH